MALVFSRGTDDYGQPRRAASPRSGRLVIAVILVLISLATYYSSGDVNVITGEKQRVALNTKEEIALGMQAVPEMAAQHGGESPDAAGQRRVDAVGGQILSALNTELARQGRRIPYPFEFHLLADTETVNAFALPGGQVFITQALYNELETDAQLSAVIGHEVGHVLSRHSAQQIAQQQLSSGLSQAAQVAGDMDSGQLAMLVASLVNMKYGREHELEADKWGVRLLRMNGHDPRAMIDLMNILERAGRGGPPEFLSTHPKPANRIEYIEQVIRDVEAEKPA